MRTRYLHCVIVAAFALAFSHVLHKVLFPAGVGDYLVGGDVVTLRGAEPRGKNLFLRHELFLPHRPRFGWIRLLAYDSLTLYVNGSLIEQTESEGLPLSIVADLTPHLLSGKNLLAIVVRQQTFSNPPEVSVEGAYWLADGEHKLGPTNLWRSNELYEKRRGYWFALEFDDSHWPEASLGEKHIVATLPYPPRSLTQPDLGQWITSDQSVGGEVYFRRDFELPRAGDFGWIRTQASAPYRLAVNGHVIDAVEAELGTATTPMPMQRCYDISSLLRTGPNFICLVVTPPTPPPRIKVDLEVQHEAGDFYHLVSDDCWQWGVGPPREWLAPSLSAPWQPCREDRGDAGAAPWSTYRQVVHFVAPLELSLRRMAVGAVLFVAVFVVSWLAAFFVARRLCVPNPPPSGRGVSPAFMALIPVTVLVSAAILATYDPRIAAQHIYRPYLLLLAFAILLVQWALLRWRTRSRRASTPVLHWLRAAVPRLARPGVLVVVLVVTGGYLRFVDLAARPLSPDEVSMYRTTMGFLERGFPSIVIHPDIPPVYASTSELVYCGTALTGLFTDNDRLVVRIPAACWGTLTIFLVFHVTRRMFLPWAGVLAAAVYAFAPYCVAMANLGRYYSQLQAFTILTLYFFYQTLAPPGPLNRRALWLTVLSFLAMYFSWEGSALVAVPMVAAALVLRRDRIGTLFAQRSVWIGMAVIAVVVLLQSVHRAFVQIGRPLFGSGASDVAMTPMWTYPGFDLWYYVFSAAWDRDTLLPVVSLLLAAPLTVRHVFRKPARFVFIIFLCTGVFMALVLPVTGKRYSYHLLPLWLMLSGASLLIVIRSLARPLARQRDGRSALRLTVAAALGGGFLVAGTGRTLDLAELRYWRIAGAGPDALNLPGQEGSTRYVAEHMQQTDVVIVNAPHVTDHYLGRRSDYWLQSIMHLQATLDDFRVVPLHRLEGAVMLRDVDHLREVFAEYDRVWFITEPVFNARTNVDETTAFIRSNMEVVYEDFSSLVLFRECNHRTVAAQHRDEEALEAVEKPFLP